MNKFFEMYVGGRFSRRLCVGEDLVGFRGWRGEGAVGVGGVDERCLLWVLTRWFDWIGFVGWRGFGFVFSSRFLEIVRRRGKVSVFFICCFRR